jgi:hypothetical protein
VGVNLRLNRSPPNITSTVGARSSFLILCQVVTDYFLSEDYLGKIHFEGDHKVHVIKMTRDADAERSGQP